MARQAAETVSHRRSRRPAFLEIVRPDGFALSSGVCTLFIAGTRGEEVLINTDYLIVGAGASGLAFADALLAEADAEVTMVDRGPAVGGHWRNAYPFLRLPTPSSYHGVNSLALGHG